jgi:hypothetical protein
MHFAEFVGKDSEFFVFPFVFILEFASVMDPTVITNGANVIAIFSKEFSLYPYARSIRFDS